MTRAFWPSRQVIVLRTESSIIKHTTNPEFKCVPHVIKDSLHFDANYNKYEATRNCWPEAVQ